MHWLAILCLCACVRNIHSAVQDLTHTFDENANSWPGILPFKLTPVLNDTDTYGFWVAYNNFESCEHVGTHMDAPIHFAKNGAAMHEIPLERLIGKAVVLDIRTRVEKNKDAELMPSDITAWEENYRKINKNDIVFVQTGMDRYYGNKTAYVGSLNISDPYSYHNPGIHPSAAKILAEDRKVAGVGIDSLNPDRGMGGVVPPNDKLFPVHRILLPNKVFIIENVANLDTIPRDGAVVFVAGQKIHGGSGGPVRLIAVWGENDLLGSRASYLGNSIVIVLFSIFCTYNVITNVR